MTGMIPAIYRPPFSPLKPQVRWQPEGCSLADMMAEMDGLPEDFPQAGHICVNGHEVPRALWSSVRPKPGPVTEVTFHAPIRGGGGNGGRNKVLAAVASIALIAAVGFVAGGGLAGRGVGALRFGARAFGPGGLGARLGAAAIGIAGNAALQRLVAPGVPQQPAIESARGGDAASIDGNMLSPDGPVPRVLGTRKVFPPFVCEPLVYYDAGDEVVEAVVGLAGPHALSDVKLGNMLLTSLDDVASQILEGWPGGEPLSLVSRQARTEDARMEVRCVMLEADGITVDTSAEGGWEPRPVVLTTRDRQDEFWIGLNFPQGLSLQSGAQNVRVPFRLRLRQQGSGTWINLPEMHFAKNVIRELRASIRLIWSDAPSFEMSSPVDGWIEARRFSPGQTLAPAAPAWTADASFGTTGDTYLGPGNAATSGVMNVRLGAFDTEIWLDTAVFPKGVYEVEISRGWAFSDGNFNSASYQFNGSVRNFFGASQEAPLRINEAQNDKASTAYVVRSSGIWNETPVPGDDFAVVAVRARNRQLPALSVIASGYVRDWDGSAWSAWTTTANPAPHLRDIFVGALNADPVPVALVDDADLVAWRAACIAEGYEVNTVIEGDTVDSAAQVVAAAGFAVPRMTNLWGVVRGRDLSAEDPVQIFTPDNSRGFAMSKDLDRRRVPDGIRATFRDATRDYSERQIIEPPGAIGGVVEPRTYVSEVTEAQVRRRAAFDLKSLRLEATDYSLEVSVEAMLPRRGDLIAVTHDSLSEREAGARVDTWTVDATGALTGLRLDRPVPVVNEADWFAQTDVFLVGDVFSLGEVTAARLRLPNGGIETHELSNATGETDLLTLKTPVASAVAEKCLVDVGPLSRETDRMILDGIEWVDDLNARITMIDETPELWA